MLTVTAKLGNMRKAQRLVVFQTDKGNYVAQSDKAIGMFDQNGDGLLNTNGCHFAHLSQVLGAKPYKFPDEFVAACMIAKPEIGDLLGATPETGPVYFGGAKEI